AIRRIVAELLAPLPPTGEIDVISAFAWPLPLCVLGELLGLPREDLAQLHVWGNDWILVQQEGPLEKAACACARHRRLAALFSRCSPPARTRADRRSDRRASRRSKHQ